MAIAVRKREIQNPLEEQVLDRVRSWRDLENYKQREAQTNQQDI
jgi:hypothetical protein